jgi:pimeloyl-ACP methyl ester carboxylesterase
MFTPTCPVLFIYGKRKPFMFHSSAWAEGLASRAGSRAVGFDTGHWVMIEKPDQFSQTVVGWMAASDVLTKTRSDRQAG